ncbi:unnamed protein product [Effrenium voratum]|nr:unnamed protein product [Effrenium voratum]CAJ1351962.1 unnamed protein product [Effrenium voratum]
MTLKARLRFLDFLTKNLLLPQHFLRDNSLPAGFSVKKPAMPETCCSAFFRKGSQRLVRTTADGPLPPKDALKLLKEGNDRFASGKMLGACTDASMRKALVEQGQAPHTAIIGCADSRAPLEAVFDAMPGDIFVLRNAGNTCTHSEGSMVGSLEFCTGALGSRLIVVLGHTKCGAINGATKAFFDGKTAPPAATSSALQGLLQDLGSVAEQAAHDMGPHAEQDAVAAHAVKVNVFHTIDFLLKFSESIREKVKSGQVEIQGAVYQLDTGRVDFMGRSPRQQELLSCKVNLPPSMSATGSVQAKHGVRTTEDPIVPAAEALKLLKAGNDRFAVGASVAPTATSAQRQALVSHGQAPHSAVLGCADSRVPVDTVFDAVPGDVFVLRNAGNTCTHAEGSMVGSLEFAVSKLKSRLILVLGHTNCGAIAGAASTFMNSPGAKAPGSALEGLLMDLTTVAKKASEDLAPGASLEELASHAVKVNVFHSMNFLIQHSETLRAMVKTGELEIQGGIYHLATGRVEFLGRSPVQAEVLASCEQLPPSMAGALTIRTPGSGPVKPEAALQLLQAGNLRFTSGTALAGKITPIMRKALVVEGQAPHTAIVGCADSRAPLETVFDAMPGDIFALRNAGNTCTHAEGSILGSLEFCTAALGSKLILVLGHTSCGAIKGATKAYIASKAGKAPQVSKALDALLNGLSVVAGKAEAQLGSGASEEQIADLSVKLNVFHTIDFLLQYSGVVREKVISGEVDIQGGVYDLESGKVEFLGRSPNHTQLLRSGASLPPSIKN